MRRGQIGFEMLIVFAIAITLVIWSAKLVDSLTTSSVQEKIQVSTLAQLVDSACSTRVSFSSEVACSFEKGQAKSYRVLTQGKTLTVLTGDKNASKTAVCETSGGPLEISCNEAVVCFNYNAGQVVLSNGACLS